MDEVGAVFVFDEGYCNPKCDFCGEKYRSPGVHVSLRPGPYEICPSCILKGPREVARETAQRPKEAFHRAIRSCHQDVKALAKWLGRLAGFQELLGDISMRRDEFQFFQAVIALCAKAIKTFRGVHLLCSRGVCEDALAMSRTLVEILTSIKHLNTGDRRANARQFWEYTALKADGLARLFDGVPHAGPEPPDSADQFRQFVGDIRSRMSKRELKNWLARSWHRRGVVPLASTLGLPSLERPYRFASSAVHATDVLDHFDVRPDGGFVVKCLPGDRWARLVLSTSNLLFLGILKEIDSICGFGLDAELMRIFAESVPEAGSVA